MLRVASADSGTGAGRSVVDQRQLSQSIRLEVFKTLRRVVPAVLLTSRWRPTRLYAYSHLDKSRDIGGDYHRGGVLRPGPFFQTSRESVASFELSELKISSMSREYQLILQKQEHVRVEAMMIILYAYGYHHVLRNTLKERERRLRGVEMEGSVL